MEDRGWTGSILIQQPLNPPFSILQPHPEVPSTSFTLSLHFVLHLNVGGFVLFDTDFYKTAVAVWDLQLLHFIAVFQQFSRSSKLPIKMVNITEGNCSSPP